MAVVSIWLLSLMSAQLVIYVQGHARLMSPPSRSSLWRLGYSAPKNFNDNELYCGGFSVQWNRNKGKCGICGDPYQAKEPRANEAGGLYGLGIISEHYLSGQTIDVVVDISTNHLGYFQFKLCPNNDVKKDPDQECLDKYVLAQPNGDTKYDVSKKGKGKVTIPIQLPKGLTCSQCVFQWTYTAGNNWGQCGDGTGKMGCGPQETFRGCADIEIQKSYSTPPKSFKTKYGPSLKNAPGKDDDSSKTFVISKFNTYTSKLNELLKNRDYKKSLNAINYNSEDFADPETSPYFNSNNFLIAKSLAALKDYEFKNGYYVLSNTKTVPSHENQTTDGATDGSFSKMKSNADMKSVNDEQKPVLPKHSPVKKSLPNKPLLYLTALNKDAFGKSVAKATGGGFLLGGRKYKDFWFLK